MRGFLSILAVPFVLAAALVFGLVAEDPLSLRGWGDDRLELDDRPYPIAIRPLLLGQQLRSGAAVKLVGTSTAIEFEEAMLAEFSAEKTAVNLAQAGQRIEDARALALAAARSPGTRRLILELGDLWRFDQVAMTRFGRRTIEAIDPHWWQAPEFNREILQALWNERRGSRFYIPEWDIKPARFAAGDDARLTDAQVQSVRDARRGFNPRDYPDWAAGVDCSRFGVLNETIIGLADEAERHGLTIDIYFPPIPYGSYPSFWSHHYLRPLVDRPNHQAMLDMQYCVVERVAQVGNDRLTVHGLHTDPRIVGDLRGLRDPLHIGAPAKFRTLAEGIAKRRFVMTPANFDTYAARLRSGIIDAATGPLPPID